MSVGRVDRNEGRDEGRHVAPTESHRSGDPQQAARRSLEARHGALGLLCLLGDARTARVELRPDLGEVHGPRGAVQELGADARLERADLLAHGRPRLAERLRRGGKAPRLHHSGKEHHLSGLNHLVRPPVVRLSI